MSADRLLMRTASSYVASAIEVKRIVSLGDHEEEEGPRIGVAVVARVVVARAEVTRAARAEMCSSEGRACGRSSLTRRLLGVVPHITISEAGGPADEQPPTRLQL